ncbi:GntR family transcriptional regulator [Paracoccus lichenicola]|nr:GntR family transcriptional regulator [Paracoccus lichenicola]
MNHPKKTTGRIIPLWERIAEELRTRIADGSLPVDSYLPNEIDLAGQYGVSRNTIRASLRQLADQGLITRIRKKGSRVVKKEEIPVVRTTVNPFIALREIHAKSRLRIDSFEPFAGITGLCRDYTPFGRDSSDWLRLSCYRILDKTQEPWNPITLYFPRELEEAARRMGKTKASAIDTIGDLGLGRAMSARTFAQPVLMPDDCADYLKIPRKMLATQITTLYFNADDHFFHLSVSLNPVDRFQIELTFQP